MQVSQIKNQSTQPERWNVKCKGNNNDNGRTYLIVTGQCEVTTPPLDYELRVADIWFPLLKGTTDFNTRY